ncbi:hypothetical protein HK102_007819, partial [Quaeritorhiza haematococci]
MIRPSQSVGAYRDDPLSPTLAHASPSIPPHATSSSTSQPTTTNTTIQPLPILFDSPSPSPSIMAGTAAGRTPQSQYKPPANHIYPPPPNPPNTKTSIPRAEDEFDLDVHVEEDEEGNEGGDIDYETELVQSLLFDGREPPSPLLPISNSPRLPRSNSINGGSNGRE